MTKHIKILMEKKAALSKALDNAPTIEEYDAIYPEWKAAQIALTEAIIADERHNPYRDCE